MIKNTAKAIKEANKLENLMKKKFPGQLYTTSIDFWNDDTFQVICKCGRSIPDTDRLSKTCLFLSHLGRVTYTEFPTTKL